MPKPVSEYAHPRYNEAKSEKKLTICGECHWCATIIKGAELPVLCPFCKTHATSHGFACAN